MELCDIVEGREGGSIYISSSDIAFNICYYLFSEM